MILLSSELEDVFFLPHFPPLFLPLSSLSSIGLTTLLIDLAPCFSDEMAIELVTGFIGV